MEAGRGVGAGRCWSSWVWAPGLPAITSCGTGTSSTVEQRYRWRRFPLGVEGDQKQGAAQVGLKRGVMTTKQGRFDYGGAASKTKQSNNQKAGGARLGGPPRSTRHQVQARCSGAKFTCAPKRQAPLGRNISAFQFPNHPRNWETGCEMRGCEASRADKGALYCNSFCNWPAILLRSKSSNP